MADNTLPYAGPQTPPPVRRNPPGHGDLIAAGLLLGALVVSAVGGAIHDLDLTSICGMLALPWIGILIIAPILVLRASASRDPRPRRIRFTLAIALVVGCGLFVLGGLQQRLQDWSHRRQVAQRGGVAPLQQWFASLPPVTEHARLSADVLPPPYSAYYNVIEREVDAQGRQAVRISRMAMHGDYWWGLWLVPPGTHPNDFMPDEYKSKWRCYEWSPGVWGYR